MQIDEDATSSPRAPLAHLGLSHWEGGCGQGVRRSAGHHKSPGTRSRAFKIPREKPAGVSFRRDRKPVHGEQRELPGQRATTKMLLQFPPKQPSQRPPVRPPLPLSSNLPPPLLRQLSQLPRVHLSVSSRRASAQFSLGGVGSSVRGAGGLRGDSGREVGVLRGALGLGREKGGGTYGLW